MIQNFNLNLLCFFVLLISCLLPSNNVIGQTRDDLSFALSMEQVELGNWQKAQQMLEQQLTENPSWLRARVELAKVYAHQGKYRSALESLSIVLADGSLPKTVRDNLHDLQQELLQKSAAEPGSVENRSASHQFTPAIALGWGFDDNVAFTSGDYFLLDDPLLDSVIYIDENGEEFVFRADGYAYDSEGNRSFLIADMFDLGEAHLDTSYLEYSVDFGYQYTSPDKTFNWRGEFVAKATDNTEFAEFNRRLFRATTELKWSYMDNMKFGLTGNVRLVKRDGQKQVQSESVAPFFTYFNPYGSWEFGLDLNQRKFENTSYVRGDFISEFVGFETKNIDLSIKWSKLFWDNRLLLFSKAEWLNSNASDDLDSTGTKYTLAFVFKMSERLKWSMSIYNLELDYDEDVLEGATFTDKSKEFRTKLSYEFDAHWQVLLSAERGLRNSELYYGLQSDKSAVKLAFKYTF